MSLTPNLVLARRYSLGGDSTNSNGLMKRIACENGGVWSYVSDSGDLRSQMAHFYEYFAQLRATTDTETVVWVEPYLDASGAGRMTTASKAIYDYDVIPPQLIGVVGADLLTKDIKQVESHYEEFLTFLAKRSTTCPGVNLTSP